MGRCPAANGPVVGAARIIDISDEKAPSVVSNLRLAVHEPENRDAIKDDPGAEFVGQGYAGALLRGARGGSIHGSWPAR